MINWFIAVSADNSDREEWMHTQEHYLVTAVIFSREYLIGGTRKSSLRVSGGIQTSKRRLSGTTLAPANSLLELVPSVQNSRPSANSI